MSSTTHQNDESHTDVLYDLQTKWNDLDKTTFITVGAIAYIGEQLVAHPLETLRSKLQVSRQKFTWSGAKSFIARNGILGLYVGFWPSTLGYMPGNAIYFLTYSYLKDRLQSYHNQKHPDYPKGQQAPWVSFTSAMLADIAAISFICPLEVVVQRLMVQDSNNKLYKNSFDAVRKIHAEEGFKGFYKGLGPLVLNSAPASAIWWVIYETSKTATSAYIDKRKREQSGSTDDTIVIHKHKEAQLLSGGIAGLVTTVVTNPLDVVRTRIQTQSLGKHIENSANISLIQYNSTWHAITSMYRNEGVGAFMKGVGPRMLQWTFFSSITAVLYEFVVDISTKKKA